MSNDRPAHLLSLPRELRDAIYQFAIPDPPVIEMARRHASWLLACKQIFSEAAPMVYDQCCLYKATDVEDQHELLDQLVVGYVTSFRNTASETENSTFELVKRMISYVAIDVHLYMNVEDMTWLCDEYFARISDLPNLKALYISLNLEPGVARNNFKQQLARSDLRIFELVKFISPVKSLLGRVPKGCKVHWAVPEGIRWSANGGTYEYSESNLPYMTQFMREVQEAVVATEHPDEADHAQHLSESTAGMSLMGSDGVTQ